MLKSTTSRQGLAAFAAICLLGVALPVGTAFAQETKTKTKPAAEATTEPAAAPVTEVEVEIPTIDAVDSSLDEDTLREIFSGNLADNADGLASLTATSITIPEITLTISTETDDAEEPEIIAISFADIVLSDVVDGVAGSISVSGAALIGKDDSSVETGELSASNFDIGGVLGIYGLVDAGEQTELQTVYTDFHFDGGTITAEDVDCTFGEVSVAEFKARPLHYSMADIMALSETMPTEGENAEMSPEDTGKLLRIYADIFTAFESSPATIGPIACDAVDEAGKPVSIGIDGIAMDGMSPGTYPGISLDGFAVTAEADDTNVAVGNVTFKPIDLSAPLATLATAPEVIDQAWLDANGRGLIPAFGGFSLAGVVVNVPDPQSPGDRIAGNLDAFDLTLASYLNGIPTDIASSASGLVVNLAAGSDDPQVQQLLALGITSFDLGYDLAASWSEAEDTITVSKLSVSGADLATVGLTGTLVNATEALFGLDDNAMLEAGLAVAIRDLKLDVLDEGLSDIILARVSADQGSDAATMRPVYASLAEGTIIGVLAGAAEAQGVGAAVSAFVAGTAKHLVISLTAKDPAGLSFTDFSAATDPMTLIPKVTIDATAE